MDNRIDMSLDEIIKKDRISAGKPGKCASLKKVNKIWSTGQSRAKSGEVKKIGAVSRAMKPTVDKPNRFTNSSTRPNQFKSSSNHLTTTVSSPSLLITNLHPKVTDSDIRELFSPCGPVKSCSVHYSSTGQSQCTAQVVFSRLCDAKQAEQKYNQVPLDGRPMNIQPLITTTLKTNIAQRLGSIAQQAFNKTFKHGRSKHTNSSKPNPGSSRANMRANPKNKFTQKKTLPTVDQLNADLDSYIPQKQM